MSFTAVIGTGAKLARALILGANTIEGLKGAAKGSEKRELALKVAQEALGFCQDSQALPMTPKLREALADYTDAYVKLQNAIADVSGVKP